MGTVTAFPNGISSEGLRYKAGTLAGTVGGTIDTGLGTCLYVVAGVQQAGTGSAYAGARASGGSAIITVHAASGSAATVAGTVNWIAAGV